MNNSTYTLGIDIGSTTVKIAVLDDKHTLLFADYKRHFANIQETLADLLKKASSSLGDLTIHPMITGSGGLTLANHLDVPFVQEVIAVSTSLQTFAPKTDVAIELGGEDAKIIYFEGGNVEQRMNGICAGGTGSFIDQMASLLQTDASGLNEYAKHYQSLYTIAARCGVFAKSDIQPLINEGATQEDLSASIFQAVVNQTISGLACGKPIRGHVAFLGGPLHFLSELKAAFVRTLKLDEEHTIALEHSHLFAAIGSALNAREEISVTLSAMIEKLSCGIRMEFEVARMEPLFASEEEYDPPRKYYREKGGARHLSGELLPRHRRRLHHHKDRSRRGGRPASILFLQQQQRQPSEDSDPFHSGDLRSAAGRRKDRPLLFHRLWGSTVEGRFPSGRRRGGDRGALLRRRLL